MRRTVTALLGVLSLLTAIPPLLAHHSFAAEFDGNKPVTLKGPVRKVEWRNPHIWVYLDVREPNGKLTPWQCEGGAPNALTRQGWTRNTFTLNEDIIVEGWQAKNGTNTCNARTWKLGDGRVVLAGTSNEAATGGVR